MAAEVDVRPALPFPAPVHRLLFPCRRSTLRDAFFGCLFPIYALFHLFIVMAKCLMQPLLFIANLHRHQHPLAPNVGVYRKKTLASRPVLFPLAGLAERGMASTVM